MSSGAIGSALARLIFAGPDSQLLPAVEVSEITEGMRHD
jgi:hypothetical protein